LGCAWFFFVFFRVEVYSVFDKACFQIRMSEELPGGGGKRERECSGEIHMYSSGDEEQSEKDNRLLLACKIGQLCNVQAALAAGASVFAQNNTGRTGLSLVCERQDWNVAFEIITYLLRKRCLPSVPDRGGYNALHIAAFYSSFEVVSLLLEHHPTLAVKIPNNCSRNYCLTEQKKQHIS
jgi:hypothetical protein